MRSRVISEAWRSLFSNKRSSANPLEAYFFSNPGRLIHKWHHYFDIYHRHFASFRGCSPVVLEIGVYHGGSLQMWKEYFGPGAHIVGLDIDPRCRQFEEAQISVMIGDQENPDFLADVKRKCPRVDIVIDDGGHTMRQQTVSFEQLYPHLQPEGIYLCEDIHTSFMPKYGGGYRKQGSFLEYSKGVVDRLFAWHSEEPEIFQVDAMTRSTYALHFYDCVLVVEKRPIEKPRVSKTGKPSL